MRWSGDAAARAAQAGGRAGIAAAARAVLAASQARVPVDSGALRGSGQVSAAGARATVSYGAAHATAVHEGTRSMAGRPFLRMAMGEVDALSIVAGEIRLG